MTKHVEREAYFHRCFDGSVKELRDEPNPYLHPEAPAKRMVIGIYLSSSSTALRVRRQVLCSKGIN